MGNKDGFYVHVNTFPPAALFGTDGKWEELGRWAEERQLLLIYIRRRAKKPREGERARLHSRTVRERNPRVDKLGAFLSFL